MVQGPCPWSLGEIITPIYLYENYIFWLEEANFTVRQNEELHNPRELVWTEWW